MYKTHLHITDDLYMGQTYEEPKHYLKYLYIIEFQIFKSLYKVFLSNLIYPIKQVC
jgi:hypothetical protein